MPTGCKIEESSLHDAEGETGHPIIPCGVHHPLPPDLFDLHARTPKAKTNAISPSHQPRTWETRNAKRRFPRGFCRRRHFAERLAHLSEDGAVERGRPPRRWPRCRLRILPSIRVGLLARSRLRRPGRPRECGRQLHSSNRRHPPAPRTASSVPLSNQQNWRWSHMKSGADWQLTPGPAPSRRRSFFLES